MTMAAITVGWVGVCVDGMAGEINPCLEQSRIVWAWNHRISGCGLFSCLSVDDCCFPSLIFELFGPFVKSLSPG